MFFGKRLRENSRGHFLSWMFMSLCQDTMDMDMEMVMVLGKKATKTLNPLNSSCSKPGEQTGKTLHSSVSLRRWDLPSGTRACSAHTAAAIQCCLHHTGVCQCEKAPSWTKDWTTVCRQGPLTKTTFQHSAVSPTTLSPSLSASRSGRGPTVTEDLVRWPCHTSLSVPSRGAEGWHQHSPLSQVVAGTTQMPNSVHKTVIKHQQAPRWLITVCCAPQPDAGHSL